jgi:F0F1-type ATP synthase assembly protein I
MSVKTKLARKAVKTTAKHTARGTASKLTHKPFRSITLLTAGALLGLVVGWLVANSKSTEQGSGTGAVS